MSQRIPVLKFGGRTLQGKRRFGPDEDQLVEECRKLDKPNDIYRLLEQRRNRARARRLREIAEEYVLPLYEQGLVPVVVVSAFDWATDKLNQLSAYISPQPVEREYARLLMSGELRANSSLAMVLEEMGCPAYSMTGREAGIVTKGGAVHALIDTVKKKYVTGLINERIVPVVAGFQGYYHNEATGRDEVSILGRGGSDLTAVALASALGQSEVVVYTNVDGLYDCDPRTHQEARKLDEVEGRELLAWPNFPQVMQKEAVRYALEQGVNIWICSGFAPDQSGTLIVCA